LDDSTESLTLHAGSGGFNEGVSGVKMAPKRGIKIANLVVEQGSTRRPAGVVDEDVDRPQGLHRRSKGRCDAFRFLKVQCQGLMSTRPEATKFFAKGGQRRTVSSTDGDVRTGFGEHFCGCLTNAFARTADEGMLAFKRCRYERVVAAEQVHVSWNSP